MKDIKTFRNAVIGYLVLVTSATTIVSVVRARHGEFFFNLASAIILSWIVALIVYYIWAIYFYNVNMGLNDDDWDDLNKKEARTEIKVERENPHKDETLGLPKGTLRGTIALSLVVAGLAMVIASFQMNQTFDANELFVDNFEFFKTAFLMMIAFYFGDKALGQISSRNQGVYRPDRPTPRTGRPASGGQTGASEMNRQAETDFIANTPAAPLPTAQGAQLKKTMLSGAPESVDDGDTSNFDDKESVG